MYMEETESSFMTEAECLGCQSALSAYGSNLTVNARVMTRA